MADAKVPTRVTKGIPFNPNDFICAPSFDLGISQQHNVVAGSTEKMYAERHAKQMHEPLPSRKSEVPKSNKTKGAAQAKNLRKLAEEQPMEEDEEMEEVAEQDPKFYVKRLPRLSPRYSCYTNSKVFSDLESNLSKRQQELFSKTIFGKFLGMQHFEVTAQMFRCFMVRELRKSKPDAFLIEINGFVLRFTILEFAIMSGLNCYGDEGVHIVNEDSKNRLMDKYFPGSENNVRKNELELCFKQKNKNLEDGDAVKLAILYFIHSYILSGEHKSTRIPRLHFDLVENGKYKDYPWGKVAFNDLIRSIHQKMTSESTFFCLRGFPPAMQVWLYETCSSVYPNLAIKHGNSIPRILNWRTIESQPSYSSLMSGMFKDDDSPGRVTYANVVPTIEEIEALRLPVTVGDSHQNTPANEGTEVDEYDNFISTPPDRVIGKQQQRLSHSPPHKKRREMRLEAGPTKKLSIRHATNSASVSHPSDERLAKQHVLQSEVPVSAVANDQSRQPSPRVHRDVPATMKDDDVILLRQELREFKQSVEDEFRGLCKLIDDNFKQVFELIKGNQSLNKGADRKDPMHFNDVDKHRTLGDNTHDHSRIKMDSDRPQTEQAEEGEKCRVSQSLANTRSMTSDIIELPDCPVKFDNLEDFFVQVSGQIKRAQSLGSFADQSSPIDDKIFATPRSQPSVEMLATAKGDIERLLIMPSQDLLLPETAQIKAKKDKEDYYKKAAKKVLLIDELTKDQELYTNLKDGNDKLEYQISKLKASLKDAKTKRKAIQDQKLRLAKKCFEKTNALDGMEAEFLVIEEMKELADLDIARVEESLTNFKSKIIESPV
ncbi:uncharacterized protein LOC132058032 [Lycium ferocissimum]|uniref:uncharacterized protein LOC132058032 n=1 Tax=Lycium ferocissimum TaxID=112874 RepID=UPI002814CCF3|nr:uncharacterized protein LOC132058032 [Lycium ferocissimum]